MTGRAGRWRVAAIAVLAAALPSCAHTPAPASGTVSNGETEEAEPIGDARYPCGGVITSVERKPEDVVQVLSEEIRQSCAAAATSGDRHGEIRIVLRADPIRIPSPDQIHPWRPKIEAELHLDLTEDDRRCVENAAGTAFRSLERKALEQSIPLDRVWTSLRQDMTFYLELGEPKPLFSPKQDLIGRWLAAARSNAARARFQAWLPADVTLTKNDCLSVVKRPAFDDRVERWLASVGAPVDAFWESGDQGIVPPEGKSHPRRYVVGTRTTLVHYQVAGPDRDRQEICLLPFDDELREHLRDRVVCSVDGVGGVRCEPDRSGSLKTTPR